MAPNMPFQRTRSRALLGRSPLNGGSLGAGQVVLRVLLASVVVAVSIQGAGLAQTGEPARTAELSWNFEAPDMPDVQNFNEAGSRVLPVVVIRSTECEYPLDSLRLQLFQFMKGSSRGKDRKPMTHLSNGVVVTIVRKPGVAMRELTIGLAGGESDWSAYEPFTIPRLSAAQWAAFPVESSWVFEFPGRRLMGNTKYWNYVEVKCK